MKNIGSHDHLVKMIEYGPMAERALVYSKIKEKSSYLALSYAENGALIEVLNRRKEVFPERWVRYWFRQIVQGLKHIH